MIPLLKTLHIAALTIWCAGLLCLPALLVQHARVRSPEGFAELRRFVRRLYVRIMTPAAVVAVAAGTALIFARGLFVGWMFLKLGVVAMLVGLQAYEGHLLTAFSTGKPQYERWKAFALVIAGLVLVTATIVIVLAKPALTADLFPRWLLEPRVSYFSPEETPI